MSTNTTIEWTDKTWNPVTGCSRVSAGCRNCYAERIAERFRGAKAFPNGFDVTLHPGRLGDPLKWRKPARVFVNSMSDLFHESIPFEFILETWNTMAAASQHTFQVLTKRPRRMVGYFEWLKEGMRERGLDRWEEGAVPVPNIHLGVSVENQAAADERIPLLLQVPAAVRFLSCEPLIGPVTFRWAKWMPMPSRPDGSSNHLDGMRGIGWVIAGGESGPGARPMHPDWARDLRDQCQEAGVPFFFKQWGEWILCPEDFWGRAGFCSRKLHASSAGKFIRAGKIKSGRLLDGREWNEFPEINGALNCK